MRITSITARQIFDSRGYPTVECDVHVDTGHIGRASVPSGSSTGSREALELRDGTKAYDGKGVEKVLDNIRTVIAPALVGQDTQEQQAIDKKMVELDDTANKSHLGANATLAVSLAVAKAAAAGSGLQLYEYVGQLIGNDTFSLPMPMLNILNGGKHAAGSTDIQEFMIVPVGAPTFPLAMRTASEIYHALGMCLREKGYATTVGDEGGYAPQVTGGTEEAMELISMAVLKAGYQLGKDVALALDVAASELVKGEAYDFAREGRHYTTEQLIDRYAELAERHPIVSIEDGLSEDDWDGWTRLTARLGKALQLVGDDLLVTNTKYLQEAIGKKAANAILIKPNQIGTLSETIEAVKMAQGAGWRTVISHRSGETEDVALAHLAVGLNAGQIKTGSFSRGERMAKYNELLRIAERLSDPVFQHPFLIR